MGKITVTAAHVKLLGLMDFDWDDDCEFGAVSSDPKRPFGNSGVRADIEEALGLAEDSLSDKEAKALVVPLAAIVEHIVRTADLTALVGRELEMPWRAGRTIEEARRG